MATTSKATVLPKRSPSSITDNQNVSIKIDVVSQETHSLSDTITDHPVEEGSDVSDHDRPDPDQVTLECLITNTPLDGTAPDPNRGNNAWQSLKNLRGTNTLLSVFTTLGRYDNMKITTLSATRTSQNFAGLEFSVTFKKIRIVQNKLTSQRVSKQKNVTKKVDTGSQTPPPVEQSRLDAGYEASKGKSGTDAVTSFVGGMTN